MRFFDKLRTQKLLSFTLILFTLSIGIVIGTLINSGVKAAKDTTVAPGATPLTIPNPVELSNTFSQIAKMVEPSVVNISTTYLPKAPVRARNRQGGRQIVPPNQDDQGGDSGGMDEFLYRFFGNSPLGGGGGGGVPESDHRGEALGSGVVVDKAGYILTNNHVVDKADRIQVKFMNDPTEYNAKVVGVDAPTDLAVIRVEGKHDFTPAKIGNSDSVQVGDWAMAIGSPFGFQATVTAGIISAKERDIPGGESTQFQHFLQTDAAINPGNSGGPLLNIRGEVVGINTAIASRSGGYQGIGFAMPINTAAMVYNEIIKNGKVTRGSIGIRFTADAGQAANLLKANGVSEGVFVETVVPGGPSDKAGMKVEDIIVAVNGKGVKNGNELINAVTATPIGTPVTVTVLRDGKRENLKVVVSDLAQVFPDTYGAGPEKDQVKPEATAVSFGMGVVEMSASLRERLGFKESGGVQIDNVEPNSFAEDSGLLKGDVLVSINRQPVNSVADIQRVQKTLKSGDAVQFRVFTRTAGSNRLGEWQPRYVAGILP